MLGGCILGVAIMTNREWLINKMQNMSDDELAKMILVPTEMEQDICVKEDCMFRECEDCLIYWLKYERKEPIKLSDAERVILENLPKECKWIFRDLTESLVVCVNKPGKTERYWTTNGIRFLFNAFNHLFKFIKANDTEPYNIEELLGG